MLYYLKMGFGDCQVFIAPTVKFAGVGITVFVCSSSFGRGPLVPVKGNRNVTANKDILDNVVLATFCYQF